MHVGLIELLRCPMQHAEAALVASSVHQSERHIIDGALGCPVCGAEYPIENGVADLRRRPVNSKGIGSFDGAPNEEASLRLAAQLDLTETGRLLLLAGAYAAAAPQLVVMFDPAVIAVGVPPEREPHIAEHASVIRADTTIPLARSALHGAAIDATHSAAFGLQQVSALLKPRGRLVAPAGSDFPPGVTVLARDGSEWVAERTPDTTGVVELRRAQR